MGSSASVFVCAHKIHSLAKRSPISTSPRDAVEAQMNATSRACSPQLSAFSRNRATMEHTPCVSGLRDTHFIKACRCPSFCGSIARSGNTRVYELLLSARSQRRNDGRERSLQCNDLPRMSVFFQSLPSCYLRYSRQALRLYAA